MELLYKPDWEETKERYKAWWAHDYFGRCAISVYAPKSGVPDQDPPTLPDKIEDRWLDFDYVRLANEYRFNRQFYGEEALPVWTSGYPGWTFIPCFMGARIDLAETTGWVYPIADKGNLTDYDYLDFKIDPDNRWWKLALEMLRFGVEQCRGKALVSIGAFGGCGDTLAGIRGNQELLLDLPDHPGYIREFDQYLMRQWMEVYDIFYEIIRDADEGSTSWFQLWSPGKCYPSHNDFAYMISPTMFKDIFLPSIEMQTRFVDHTVHHLDGIGNFNHLDALLELPRLQAFQILPGAGKPSPLHYMDILKRVQSAGKNLHIGIEASEVRYALENLSARGLFLSTWCATEEEACALLRSCEEWSVDR